MKISADIVGLESEGYQEQIDSRWLMAYSAGLGERQFPHPLFPVCYEWPTTRELRERAGLGPLDARLVHAQHDLSIYKKPPPGRVGIMGQVVAARQKRPGVIVVFRIAALDAKANPMSVTDFTTLYRGVQLEGGDRAISDVSDLPVHTMKLAHVGDVPIAATAAHVYTECARIWNPIHTDVKYAKAAGLPDIILHGTATLAYSISRVMAAFRLKTLGRVRCRFSGMVTMPTTLQVNAAEVGDDIAFETRNQGGQTVIERGWLHREPASIPIPVRGRR